MRFLIAPEFYQEMLQRTDHTPDCYVRPGEYLHHLYLESVKFTVAQAVEECLKEARAKNDAPAVHHLELHYAHYQDLVAQAEHAGRTIEGAQLLGDPPPADEPDDA